MTNVEGIKIVDATIRDGGWLTISTLQMSL